MWSRVVEVMLGCWLAISPFIFRHPPDEPAYWINDFTTALAVITLALVSYWRPLRHAHLLNLAVGGWLIGFAYFNAGGLPVLPALQNNMLLGLLLLMFGLIPNRADEPPESWTRFNERLQENDHSSG